MASRAEWCRREIGLRSSRLLGGDEGETVHAGMIYDTSRVIEEDRRRREGARRLSRRIAEAGACV